MQMLIKNVTFIIMIHFYSYLYGIENGGFIPRYDLRNKPIIVLTRLADRKDFDFDDRRSSVAKDYDSRRQIRHFQEN